ncbi:glycoside hydrolase family 18 protein [Xylariaceae sp. AK1471]|nr:glycoside hydrolase family 18 protein [Xylariaceae sp. AK1471]
MRPALALFLWPLGIPFATAAYDPSTSNNVAVYWGQNSAGGTNTQRSLIEVCETAQDIDIILLAFLISATNIDGGLNFANAFRPTEQEIHACQADHHKTLLLSLGGAATDNTWAFTNQDMAEDAANKIWAAFGPVGQAAIRPFGSASVNGFDLDFEAPYPNSDAFAKRLRTLMDEEIEKNSSSKLYLSAAPQCPFLDEYLAHVLQGPTSTHLDFVFIQFYNNPPCDLRPSAINGHKTSIAQWDAWAAQSHSKIFLGVPAAETAVGAANRESYVAGPDVANHITSAKAFPSFAGVMIWDVSQLDVNAPFLPPIVSALGGNQSGNATGNSIGYSKHRHRHVK